jgi:ABC-2 type transport system permease protein
MSVEVATRSMRWPADRPWSRVIGLRSVYAKTVRDGRWVAIVVGLVAGGFMFGTGAPYGGSPEFATPELRRQFLDGILALPPALRGLLGEPINIETMGGFLAWRVGGTLPVILGLWPVLVLSGTLVGEASRGSLDLVASTPHARRSIALQKVAGHVTAVAVALLLAALITSWVGWQFGSLPGDEIPLGAAIGQYLLWGLLMLTAGAVAFAAGPFVGRMRALALGLAALFTGYLVESYASLSPIIDSLRPLSWYSWTSGHRPMAGVTDWAPVALLAVVCVGFLAIGVWAFGRRDIGSSAALGWLRLPSLPSGIGGPVRRQLADRTGMAIGFGIGMGLYAVLIVASAEAFAESIASIPQIAQIIEAIYPGVDFHTAAGVLQLTFFGFGSFILGLAGAALLMGWAGDEERRRLDVVLSTPLSRGHWAWRSGLGALAAVAVMTLVLGAFVGAGILAVGGDLVEPLAGTAVLGLAAAAFASVGLAVGGLVRSSLAAAVTAGLVIATFLLDTLGAALDLPEEFLELSLYKHLGQPMAGIFDPVGLAVAAALVVGGLAVGTVGLTRRDIGR